MFSRMQFIADASALSKRFSASLPPDFKIREDEVTGFEHRPHPLIRTATPGTFDVDYRWGIVPPDWQKNPQEIWNHTISAKLEYLEKRNSWRQVSANRCLIPVTGFYEFHWNDPKGKSKTKYIIRSADETIFALAGLYSQWLDRGGIPLRTFAACTTPANPLMAFIHNKDAARNYHRMPVVIRRGDEAKWLDPDIPAMRFAFPGYQAPLVADIVGGQNGQPELF
jgi:putative SOS response-associated peptidase YedK